MAFTSFTWCIQVPSLLQVIDTKLLLLPSWFALWSSSGVYKAFGCGHGKARARWPVCRYAAPPDAANFICIQKYLQFWHVGTLKFGQMSKSKSLKSLHLIIVSASNTLTMRTDSLLAAYDIPPPDWCHSNEINNQHHSRPLSVQCHCTVLAHVAEKCPKK